MEESKPQYGHVPNDQLHMYRRWIRISQQYTSLGNSLGAQDKDDANEAYRQAGVYKARAQALRESIG